ncbi:MAG: hypothetical protein WBH96_03630 [Dysgonamonadaceae bacterium]
MAINKTTTETKNKIKANSVIALPNRPQIPAEQLKQAFVKPIVDTSNSMIQELDRIVEETNAELEQVQVDITDAIDEHNTDTVATHLDIRQEITDLENDLQGQIDGIDGTLQNHESRIGELELFAENLETNITEEIEGALDNKADLVDGKVPLEQLPDMEITKQKVEDVLTGDITSHNHATEIGNHNTSETAHPFLQGKIDEAKAIAEGKSRARVFATESALNTWLSNPENVALLQIGDNFYIEETDKPDYWWNGTTIKELETQKVDLTDYAKTTDLPTKVSQLENDSEFLTEDDLPASMPPTEHNHDDRYYTETEVDTKLGGKANATHNHTKSEITDFPTIPTIPDITVNNGNAESGKYISQIAVDATNKHKLNITKENLPTLRPTIELEVASLTTLTEAEKLAIKNTLSSLIVDDKIDGTKFDDIVLVTTNDLIRLHYSSIDYYVANPQITVIFETRNTKYILHVPIVEYTYSTLTSTTTDIPDISTSITADATSDAKTASPKAVKTYVDNAISTALDNLLGGEY